MLLRAGVSVEFFERKSRKFTQIQLGYNYSNTTIFYLRLFAQFAFFLLLRQPSLF